MDVVFVSDKSIKIKSKNNTFVVNPQKKIDEGIVILTKKPDSYKEYEDKIVIDGPGEFEVSGVSIKGESTKGNIFFEFWEDNQRLLLLSSTDLEKSKEADDYTATVVLSEETLTNEGINQITSGVVIVVGDVLPAGNKEEVKKTEKINLKKIEEYKGFLVHLVKN